MLRGIVDRHAAAPEPDGMDDAAQEHNPVAHARAWRAAHAEIAARPPPGREAGREMQPDATKRDPDPVQAKPAPCLPIAVADSLTHMPSTATLSLSETSAISSLIGCLENSILHKIALPRSLFSKIYPRKGHRGSAAHEWVAPLTTSTRMRCRLCPGRAGARSRQPENGRRDRGCPYFPSICSS